MVFKNLKCYWGFLLCDITFSWLQHLVRFRWDEFSFTERKDFANVAVNLLSEMISPQEEWALKSQTAALVAEVFICSLLIVDATRLPGYSWNLFLLFHLFPGNQERRSNPMAGAAAVFSFSIQ